jgi:D-amino-acid dehydrogenase
LRYALCKGAVDEYGRISSQAGVPDLVRREGLVTVFRKRESFLAGKNEAAIRAKLNIQLREIGADELRAREPHLADTYTFATSIEEGAYLADTSGYCRALASLLVNQGGQVVSGRAIGFEMQSDGGLSAVETDNGLLKCDAAVISSGIHSTHLARMLGDRVSMASERGYHVQVNGSIVSPKHSVILSDGKIAVSRQAGGFRVAGQVELAPIRKAPNWRRADIVLHHAQKGLPGLDLNAPNVRLDRWMGHRPSTPDGLPILGRSRRCADVFYAFGHGHAGPSMAPMTAKIVGALVDGEAPAIDCTPYSAGRFRLFNRSNGQSS